MHDRTGKPLQKGDKVSILATITHLDPTEDYCNVSIETVYGQRPDGNKACISAINTAVMDKVDDSAESSVPFDDDDGAATVG